MLRTRTFICCLCLFTLGWLAFANYGDSLPAAYGQSSNTIYLPAVTGGNSNSAVVLDLSTDVGLLPGWGLLSQTLQEHGIEAVQEKPGQIQLNILQGQAQNGVDEAVVEIRARALGSEQELTEQSIGWSAIVELLKAKYLRLTRSSPNVITLVDSRPNSSFQATFQCAKCRLVVSARRRIRRPTATPTKTQVPTPIATATKTPTPKPTATKTPAPTNTPQVIATNTPSPTPTPTSISLSASQIRIASGSVKSGAQIDLLVEVTALQTGKSLGAIDFNIAYDPAVVKPISCLTNPQNQFDLSLCNVETSGVVRANALSSKGVGQAPIQLVRITFQAVGSVGKSSALDLQVTTMTDPSGQALNNVQTDGQVTISQ